MSTVIVLGSSGNVGSAVIKTLHAAHPAFKILAGVRDPASAKAGDLKGAATLVAADMSAPTTLASAIPKGVDAVFVNTPGHIDRTTHAINSVNAAKAAQAKHVVVVSVANTDQKGSVFGDQFAPIEAAVKASGVPYTILRLPLFIDNIWAHKDSISTQGKFYGPAKPDAPYTPIAVADIGAAAAEILAQPGKHANKTYVLNSAPTTHAQLAQAFTAATGKQVDYVQVPYEAARAAFTGAGFQDWQAEGILQLYHDVDAGAAYYAPTGDFAAITGKQPLSLTQWVQQVGAAFK